ncbi:MAG: tetratricopeptide repeat protein [Anaerolineae bacterium]|nr:tetratricopeptide repeat protein [Anaerolineae bacterium]
MKGISPELYNRLRTTLLHCESFKSNDALEAVFVDARISRWADDLPEATSDDKRVRATIKYLLGKRDAKGEHALVLLLRVLRAQTPTTDARHQDLAALAKEFRREFKLHPPQSEISGTLVQKFLRVVVRNSVEIITRHRIFAAIGAFLLLIMIVAGIVWVRRKQQYPLFPPASEEEILVIFADFDDLSSQRDLDIPRMLMDQMSSDLAQARMGDLESKVKLRRAPALRGDNATELAQEMGERYNAAIVIWGWYDDAAFCPKFTITKPDKPPQVDMDIHGPEAVSVGTPIAITGTFSFQSGEFYTLRDIRMSRIPASPSTLEMYIVEQMPAQISYLSLFTIAQIYFWHGQYDSGLNLLDVAIQKAQEGEITDGLAMAWFYKGFINQSVFGNDEDALNAYNAALDLTPDLVEAYSNRGLIYAQQGQYELALDDINEMLRFSPENPEYYGIRGVTYFDLGEYEKAIDDFDNALVSIRDPTFYYTRGNAHKYLGEYEQAIEDLTEAITLYSEFAWAYNSRGEVHLMLQEYDLALKDFEEAKRIDSQWATPRINLGDEFLRRGEYETALAEYDSAMMVSKQYPQPNQTDISHLYLKRAEIYDKLGNYQLAQNELDALVTSFPELSSAYIERASYFYKWGEYNKARDDLNKALQLDPDSAEVYHNLGLVLQVLGEPELAIQAYSRAIEISPDTSMFYVGRATVYAYEFDYEAALRDLEEALLLDPNNSIAYVTRGTTYTQLKQYQEAKADFENALQLDPELAYIYQEYGNLLCLLEEYEQAIVSFSRALELDPTVTSVYYDRGQAYEYLGKIDEAISDYTKFKDSSGDGYWGEWVEQKIEELKSLQRP